MEGSTSDADLNKKREWRKKMKELQKEKKRLKKEEEHKKNLMSKDSKVVIIDKKTFETFNKKTKEKGKSETTSGPIDFNDFPELKVAPEKKEVEVGSERRRTSKLTRSSWNRLPIAETLKNDSSIDTFPSLESTFSRTKKRVGKAQEASFQSSGVPEQEVAKPIKENEKPKPKSSDPMDKNQPGKKSKKKKHKDPVVLNLTEILIAKSAKKDKKHQVLGSKYRKRREDEFLSGNILDSANPKRNKGKHREKKKKRLSNLKLAIIKDRIIKAKIKEKVVELAFKNSDVDFSEEIDLKKEVENYLEMLKSRKKQLSGDTSKNQLSNDTSKNWLFSDRTKNQLPNATVNNQLSSDTSESKKSSDTTTNALWSLVLNSDKTKEKPLKSVPNIASTATLTPKSSDTTICLRICDTTRNASWSSVLASDKIKEKSLKSAPSIAPTATLTPKSSDTTKTALLSSTLSNDKTNKKQLNNSPSLASNATPKLKSSDTTKLQRFSAKYKEYCENALTPFLNDSVKELIKEIVYLQNRMFARDPIKAQARKRYVVGFREAKKYLSLKKVKMLIIAPDLEKSESKDSISDLVNELKEAAAAQNIPCVFALSRRKLGFTAHKKVAISVFAVLNYEGTEAKFASVLDNFAEAKNLFQNSPLASREEEIPIKEEEKAPIVDDITSQLASAFISVLSERKNDSDMHASDDEYETNPFLRALTHCDTN